MFFEDLFWIIVCRTLATFRPLLLHTNLEQRQGLIIITTLATIGGKQRLYSQMVFSPKQAQILGGNLIKISNAMGADKDYNFQQVQERISEEFSPQHPNN